MEQQVLTAPPPPKNIDEFLNEVNNPTTPALDSPITNTPPPVYDDILKQAPPPPPPPSGEPDFIFSQEDTAPGASPSGGEPEKKVSDTYAKKVLGGIIAAEEFATSRICAIVANTTEVDMFKYSPDDKETLLVLMEPFEEWIIDKCPAALPLFLVYAGLKTDQVMKARKIGKIIKANAAARTDNKVKDKVATAEATADLKERTRFTINKKGEYLYDRYGQYVKQGEEKELAHINDLQRILEANKPSVVKEAFNLTDEQVNTGE